MKKIYVGTSGFVNKSWHKNFYPPDTKDFLRYFSSVFNTVEINSSFYRLPSAKTIESWRDRTPKDFLFAVKMSRYITHVNRAQGVKREIKTFFKRMALLKKKLAVVLVQIPPSLRWKAETFKKFFRDLEILGKEAGISRIAFEPRHVSWFDEKNVEEIRALARKHKIALVFAHSSVFPSYEPSEENITGKFVYVRLHGPTEFAASLYNANRLKPWAKLAMKWQNKYPVFVYFNNDVHGFAIRDVMTFQKLCKI